MPFLCVSMYYLLKEVNFRRHSLPTEVRYKERGAEIHFVRHFVRRVYAKLWLSLQKHCQ